MSGDTYAPTPATNQEQLKKMRGGLKVSRHRFERRWVQIISEYYN